MSQLNMLFPLIFGVTGVMKFIVWTQMVDQHPIIKGFQTVELLSNKSSHSDCAVMPVCHQKCVYLILACLSQR